MTTSSIATASSQTKSSQTRNFSQADARRLLLRFLALAEDTPALCIWIRETRESLSSENGRKLSQEEMARRLNISLPAYRAYETFREPSVPRLRQIATAMGLDENYFLSGKPPSAEPFEEEVRRRLDGIEDLLTELRAGLQP